VPIGVAADIPEQNVNQVKPGLSPAERVQEAVGCLPALADPLSPGFKRWTIRDFTKAYVSGEITPVMVSIFSLFVNRTQDESKLCSMSL
jgi:hypothetical protein